MPTLRSCWTDPNPGNYFHGATACLSCLLVTERYQELLDLLALDRKPFWHYRRYGVDALLAMGKKSEALQYAEASRGLNQPDSAIDQACEEILISAGLHAEAYRRYGLSAAEGNSYLARFRAVAKRYPMKDGSAILADLIAMTPRGRGQVVCNRKGTRTVRTRIGPCEPQSV